MATAYDEALVLHPYICEGCTEAVPLTDFQYRERMRVYKRLLCEECKELRLTRDREKKGRARREQHGREGDSERMEARPSVPPRRSSEDDSDRYAVTSLTGFAITPATMYRCPTHPTSEWYVIDTVHCCNVLAAFEGAEAEDRAHALAERLNADERAWEAGLELSGRAT